MLNDSTKMPAHEPVRGETAANGDGVRLTRPGAPTRQFGELKRTFPLRHFECLHADGFRFYRTTFWYPFDRPPENIFESIVQSSRPLARPSSLVIGVEWWFSVLSSNATRLRGGLQARGLRLPLQ